MVVAGFPSTASVVVARRLSCHVACGIFLAQGLNSSLLHWKADSLPLSHQEALYHVFLFFFFSLSIASVSVKILVLYKKQNNVI